MGLPPGPVYNQILKKILAAKIDGEVKDRDSQLILASHLIHEAMKYKHHLPVPSSPRH
jgi:hypothetical protein